MKKNLLLTALALGVFAIPFNSCNHEAEPLPDEDTIIFEALGSASYFYRGKDSILTEAGNSTHGDFKLRFNQTAWDALAGDGKLPMGSSFPEGSLIVKEIYRADTIVIYATMLKSSASPNAANGWLWNEVKPDGSVVHSITLKGDGCTGCHSGNANRDYVNSFELH